jgi:hypothetical protein
MTRLNIVLAYHSGDFQLVQQLLRWILTLNNNVRLPNHLVLLGDSGLSKDQRLAMKELALETFSTVSALPVAPVRQGWPGGANAMFKQGMKFVQESLKGAFLWIEPDAVPLAKGWIEQIEEAYHNQPFRYMGTHSVRGERGDASLPEKWMAGIGVYPNDAFSELASFCDSEKPFDVAAANSTTPRMAVTKLIHQHWGSAGLVPTFVATKSKAPNAVTLDFIEPEAVIFHRVKDGSLIRLLSGESSLVATEETEPAPVPTPPPAPAVPPKPPIVPAVPKTTSVAVDEKGSKFGGGLTKLMKSTESAAPIQVQ